MKAFPAPAPGDIVWCRFPEAEGIRPGPKPRPALVLAVQEDCSPARVRLAYGTSQGTDDVAAWEFVIGAGDGVAFAVSGLAVPTKFSLQKVVVLDYTDHWFGLAPGRPRRDTPRLGVLHPSLVPRARNAYEATLRSLSVRERLGAVYSVQTPHLEALLQELQLGLGRQPKFSELLAKLPPVDFPEIDDPPPEDVEPL